MGASIFGIFFLVVVAAIVVMAVILIIKYTDGDYLLATILSTGIVVGGFCIFVATSITLFAHCAEPIGEPIRYEVTSNAIGGLVCVTENGVKDATQMHIIYDAETDVPYVSAEMLHFWWIDATKYQLHVPAKFEPVASEN